MPSVRTSFKAKVWLYQGQGAWHFVSLPKRLSAQILKNFGAYKRGWGSLRVTVSCGPARWQTSIFPDKKAGTYLLPLKAEARAQAGIQLGKTYPFALEMTV